MSKFENGPNIIESGFSRLSNEEQFRAVEQGVKPMSTSTELYETNLPYLKVELPLVRFEIRNGRRIVVEKKAVIDYLYYQPQEEFNAHRMKRMMENYVADLSNAKIGDEVSPDPTGPEDEKHHREMGKLLGYTDEEVEEFIQRIYR